MVVRETLSSEINVDGHIIGSGHPTFVVAEISANHLQNLERCLDIIRAAGAAGADAVKTQTYTADTMTLDCNKSHFQVKDTIWNGRNLYKLYQEAFTPWEWYEEMARVAAEEGLCFFSTAYDASSVDFLERQQVPTHKVASFELVDHALLQRMASTGKPIILSTGMASFAEIDEAVNVILNAGGKQLVLLKCTSAYPAPPEEMNISSMQHLAKTFACPVGLSSHSLDSVGAVTAVALGASVVEKHLTLSRKDGGPDGSFSLEPEEFSSMVEQIRTTEQVMGEVHFGPTQSEETSLAFRRSLFIVRDLNAGHCLCAEDIRSIRPGFGLAPKHLPEVIGRKLVKDASRGTALSWDLLG